MIRKLMRMRSIVGLAGLAVVVVAMTSCGDVIRSSRSPVQLVVTSMVAGAGNSGTLLSDVISAPECVPATDPVTTCPTVLNDFASASLAAIMKDATVSPTTNNQVTITSYHVEYARADGRNRPGVDVPYPFDAAVTATIPGGGTGAVGFEIVRHTAKLDSPLVQLSNGNGGFNNPNIISTITRVTFFGTDLVGNDVSATGSIAVNFGDFGDSK
jgi:hypothetical protein